MIFFIAVFILFVVGLFWDEIEEKRQAEIIRKERLNRMERMWKRPK